MVSSSRRAGTPSDASGWAEVTLDVTQTVFTTVKEIAEVVPAVPYLKEAAGLVCDLLTIIERVKQNAKDFKELASRAFEVVYIVYISVNEHKDWDTTMEKNLKHLMETVDAIRIAAESKTKKNWISQLIRSNENKNEIESLEKRLDEALGLFHVVTAIKIYDDLRKIRRELHEEMVHNRTTTLDLQEDLEDESPCSSSDHLSSKSSESPTPEVSSSSPFRQNRTQSPSSPPPQLPRVNMFENASGISFGGGISINNVTGDQITSSNNSRSYTTNSFSNMTQTNVSNSGQLQNQNFSPSWTRHSGSGWSPSPRSWTQQPYDLYYPS